MPPTAWCFLIKFISKPLGKFYLLYTQIRKKRHILRNIPKANTRTSAGLSFLVFTHGNAIFGESQSRETGSSNQSQFVPDIELQT